GELYDPDGAIGPGDDETPVGEFNVGGRCLQYMRGELFTLLDHLGRGLHDRGAAVHDRFRAAGAAARQQLVAVSLQETDTVERNPELFAQHLREWRRVTLPVIERAGDDSDRAVGFEADAAHLLAGRRGDFEKVAEAQPTHLSALTASAFAAPEAFPVGGFQRPLEQARKVAAVVIASRSRLERKLARPDLVAPAQLQAIDTDLGRGGIDQPLHIVVALGPPRPAIGGDVRGIG